MGKVEELQKIKKDMEVDKKLPLISKPEDVIPGDGNPNAEVVFIGEAGGYYESIQRKPFVGNAGKLLDQVLRMINLPRESVYITNMVKTRPPENRDPTPEELAAYSKYLDRELEVIQPKVIITLGRFSMGKFLPGVTISSIHGKVQRVKWKGSDIVVVPMYHPAAALRNGNMMFSFKDDFRKVPEILKQVKEEELVKEKEKKEEVEQMELI
jgi:uracil-DNA glycosylase family 4